MRPRVWTFRHCFHRIEVTFDAFGPRPQTDRFAERGLAEVFMAELRGGAEELRQIARDMVAEGVGHGLQEFALADASAADTWSDPLAAAIRGRLVSFRRLPGWSGDSRGRKLVERPEDPAADSEACSFAEDPGQEPSFEVSDLVEVVASTPQKPKARKQYINVADAIDPGTPHPEYGRVIRLKAKIKRLAGSDPLDGRTVYWQIDPGKKNHQGLPASMQAGFAGPGLALSTTTTTDSEGWTSVVEVHLSKFGGDTFVVRAAIEPFVEGEDPPADHQYTGKYTVWRKVFYEMDCMKRSSTGEDTFAYMVDMDAVKSAMKNLHVELEKVGEDDQPDHVEALYDGPIQGVRAWASQVRQWTTLNGPYIHIAAVNVVFARGEAGQGWIERDACHVEGTPLVLVGVATLERKLKNVSDEQLKIAIVSAIKHEIGHAFGLSAEQLISGSINESTEITAQGSHCIRDRRGCLMYSDLELNYRTIGFDVQGRPIYPKQRDFCELCRDAIHGRDLSSLPRRTSDPFD